jgi:hypothetical protein
MMANEQELAVLYVSVKAKTDELDRKLNELKNKASGTAKEMGSGFSNVTSTLAKLGIGAIGVSTAFNFLKGAITEARDAQIAFAQVEQAVRQTGGAAGYSTTQLKGFADELERAVSIDADVIMKDVTLQLLTFGKIQGDVFKRAQTSVLDLSAVLGSDLKGQTIQLGKALDNPIKGITALSKAGVTFTDQQKENIKKLIEQNDLFGAQSIILDEINSKYGGQAEALNTADGGFKKLEVAMNNILENVGGPMLDFIGSFIDSVTPVGNIASAADDARESSAQLSEEFNRLSNRVIELGNKTNKTTVETDLYKDAVTQLESKFPNYFKNIDLTKSKYEDVKIAIANARIELDKYIDSVISSAVIKDLESEIGKAGKEIFNFQGKIIDLRKELDDLNKTGITPIRYEDNGLTKEEIKTRLEDLISGYEDGVKFYEQKLKVSSEKVTRAQDTFKDALTPTDTKTDNSDTTTTTKTEVIPQVNTQLLEKFSKEQIVVYDRLKNAASGYVDYLNTILDIQYTNEVESINKSEDSSETKNKKIKELDAQLTIDKAKNLDAQLQYDIETGNKILDETKKNTEKLNTESDKDLEIYKQKLQDKVNAYQNYYDVVGTLDNNSLQFYKDNIQAEVNAFLKATGDKVAAKQLENELLKELEEQYYDEKWARLAEDNAIVAASMASLTTGWSNAFSLILDTQMTGAEKWKEIGNSMLNSFIGVLGQILGEYISTLVAQQLFGDVMKTTEVAAATITGTAIASAYAPAAAMASIMSFGGAAVAGGTALASTVALAQGLAIPKLAKGGAFTVPPGYPNDSFPMLVESGEKVIVVPRNKANNVPEFGDGTKHPLLHPQFGGGGFNMGIKLNSGISSNYKTSLSGRSIYESNSNIDVVNAIGALNKNIMNLDRKVIQLDIDGRNLAKIVLGNINDMESSGYDTSFM